MSIAPPSDIVLDVAQAADPLKLQAATDKLARVAAGVEPAGGFGGALDVAGRAPPGIGAPWPPLPSGPVPSGRPLAAAGTTAGQKFEAMVLQSFIENILPKDADLFGDAASADMGRSLFAEQIAAQLAKSGRIGIAKSLERDTGRGHDAGALALPQIVPPRG